MGDGGTKSCVPEPRILSYDVYIWNMEREL